MCRMDKPTPTDLLTLARTQIGKPYEFGVEVGRSDYVPVEWVVAVRFEPSRVFVDTLERERIHIVRLGRGFDEYLAKLAEQGAADPTTVDEV